jgi:hypothetical protein
MCARLVAEPAEDCDDVWDDPVLDGWIVWGAPDGDRLAAGVRSADQAAGEFEIWRPPRVPSRTARVGAVRAVAEEARCNT